MLFLHLEKDKYSVQEYEDQLVGSVLFWSGQNRIKSVEKHLIDNTRDTFVFIQKARKNPLVYYGRAYPLRMQIHWELDVPSHIAFDLYEYAKLLDAKPETEFSWSVEAAERPHSGIYVPDSVERTEIVRLQKIRTAQTQYRRQSLELWNNRCAVTSVDNTGWLIASHIKPWHESTDIEKVDPYNSLILTPNYDKLFDRGVISFSPKTGKIILPETQSRDMWNNLNRMHIDEDVSLNALPENTIKYLEYHNNYVFNFEPKDDLSNSDFVESLIAKASS